MNTSVGQSVTACVMCGAPLPAWRPSGGVVCLSQRCAAQHAALLPTFKCVQCTRPLTTTERANGYCDNPACRDAVMRERRAAAQKLEADLIERLERRREETASDHGIADAQQATYRLAILPYNEDVVSVLPAQRRTLHEAHLREQLARARVRRAAAPNEAIREAVEMSEQSSSPTQLAESQLLHAACASCRGECCRVGGDKAFISDETLVGVLQRLPTLDDDAIVAHYMQHIGTHTMTRGCVYQSERGCTLAPELRAEICHSFYCTGLRMLKGTYAEGNPVRAHFVHLRRGEVTRDRFVSISVSGDASETAQ